MPTTPLSFTGWTSKPVVPPGLMGRAARSWDFVKGLAYPTRGYVKARQVDTGAAAKPGDVFLHKDRSANEWPWYYFNTAIYPETGSDSPTALATGLTLSWDFAAANIASSGMSAFFNGTDAEAKIVRVNTGGTALEDVAFSFAKPATSTPSTASTGGNLSDGTYTIIQTWVDKHAQCIVVESRPSDQMEITLSAGTGTQTIVVPEPVSPPSRATHRRVYLTNAATPTTSSFLRASTMEVAVGNSLTISETLASMTVAVENRNSAYSTTDLSDLDADAFDIAVVHMGRLFLASTTDHRIYWSERGNPNLFYTTNSLDTGAQSHWTGAVTGMVSANGILYVFTRDSIHRVVGDFSRDSLPADTATFAVQAYQEPLDTDFGCESHRSIVHLGGSVFFMSSRGPAILQGNSVGLIGFADIEPEMATWDWSYMSRCHAAQEVRTNYVTWAVPRKTNSTRAFDGASTAGVPDTIYRFDIATRAWAAPISLETVGLNTTAWTDSEGTKGNQTYLMAMGPSGTVLKMNTGWASGVLDTSATTYNAKTADDETTTSVDISLAGVTDDALIGYQVALLYPSDDSAYPSVWAIKTITSNSTVTGTLTINWQGALTAPSGSGVYTVYIAPHPQVLDMEFRGPNGERIQLQTIDFIMPDVAGSEAVG